MALYSLTSKNDFAKLNRLPNRAQTEVYDIISGNTGNANDNFFTKRAKSIENTLGTTGAAIVGGVNEKIVNDNRDMMRNEQKAKMNDVYKQFGFNGRDDYETQLYAAEDSGNQAEVDRLLNLPGLSDALKGQANANAAETNKFASDYKDYVQNDYIGQKVNQDRGKFAGSAINTLSTALDVTGLTATPLANAIQGGVEGIADELEQNGLENFDWQRAGQNALTGAATGAVTGLVNKGVSNALAKNGGNLFKGGNAITQGLNNLGSKTAVGRLGSTLATGAARGALSGAVGGATGAGLQSALQGTDVGTGISNALQGAVQGAGQGAVTGATMAGANMAISKTPGVGKFYNELQSAKANWDKSGSNFDERLTNTLTSGDSAVGDWLMNKRQSALLGAAGNLGNSVQDVGGPSKYVGVNALGERTEYTPDEFARLLQEYDDTTSPKELSGNSSSEVSEIVGRAGDELLNIYETMNGGVGADPYNRESWGEFENWLANQRTNIRNQTPTTAKGWLKKAGERVVEDINNKGAGLSVKDVSDETSTEIPTRMANTDSWDNLAQESGFADYDDMTQKFAQANPGVEVSAENVLDWADKTNAQPYAVMQQESQDVEIMPSKTSKEAKLRYAQGQELLKQYGSIDQPMARATEAAKTFQELSDMGFTKPGDVERISNAITGSNGAVSKLTKSVIETAKPVNTFDGVKDGQTIDEYIDSSIARNVLSGTPDGKAIKTSLDAALSSLPSRTSGSVSFEDSAADTFKVVQDLEALSAELKGKGGSTYHRPNTADLHQAKVVDDVANLLKERIYDGADVKAALTPEVVQSLKAFEPNNKSWAKTVDDFAATAKTPQDLRSFQKPFVRASRYIDNQYIQAATAGGRVSSASDLLSNVPVTKAGLVKQVANAVVNSAPAHRAKAKFYEYRANKAAETPTTVANGDGNTTPTPTPTPTTTNSNYDPSTQLYNAIGRTEGAINRDNARTATYLSNAVQQANTLEDLATANTSSPSTSVYNAVNGSPTTQVSNNQKSYFQPTGDYWTDIIGVAMTSAIDADDADAFGTLYSMYQEALSNNKSTSSSEVKLTDKQRQANAAERALNDFEGAEHNFAYDVSDIPLIGGIANLGGNEYQSKAEALALQVGYMLSGATVNKEEAKNIGMAYVPQPRDNEAVRKSKLNQLRGIISDYQKTYAE